MQAVKLYATYVTAAAVVAADFWTLHSLTGNGTLAWHSQLVCECTWLA